jgi:acyl-CoA hydrolase
METFCIVRPEHLNHQGFLFGGQLLKWVDEYAWLAAARDFPDCIIVTRAMDNISFSRRVCSGDILRFEIKHVKQGNSSVAYSVVVYSSNKSQSLETVVFSTLVTFVSVDEKGAKVNLPEGKNVAPVKKNSTKK